jgi:hypothetical protein
MLCKFHRETMKRTPVQSRDESLNRLTRQKFKSAKSLEQRRIYRSRHDLKVRAIETKNPHHKGRDFYRCECSEALRKGRAFSSAHQAQSKRPTSTPQAFQPIRSLEQHQHFCLRPRLLLGTRSSGCCARHISY